MSAVVERAKESLEEGDVIHLDPRRDRIPGQSAPVVAEEGYYLVEEAFREEGGAGHGSHDYGPPVRVLYLRRVDWRSGPRWSPQRHLSKAAQFNLGPQDVYAYMQKKVVWE